MKKVILVRHGKSSWDNPDLDDHDRPLNPRGRAAAPVIAGWLDRRRHRPDIVLCSSAQRTRETASRMASVIEDMPTPLIDEGLYHASPKAILERLRGLDSDLGTVMVIGHNPGLSALSRKLSGPNVRRRCARAFEHFPTAAAAVFTADIDRWKDLSYGETDFIDFARPKELVAVS